VLSELVILDLIHRWERGERPEIEEYVRRFPEFGPLDRVPPDVIVEECRCRVKAGLRSSLDAYRGRFPVQYPHIQAELAELLATTAAGPGGGTAPTHADPAPGGSVAEQYERVELLGAGTFADVWRVRKKTSGIEKALKILKHTADQAQSRRERRALELIKNLRHTYLLATEDFWVADNRLHIVMELADRTLRDRLRECKKAGQPGIPTGELVGYIREAAEGLDFLHARHVVHRDVKPDNILLLHGHAKVADFGLAWQQEELLGPMRTFAGTGVYMAPEVWGKEGGPASDLYSLAVSYVELRQGHPPVRAAQMTEMMFAHLEGDYQFDELIGTRERKVIARAMARTPAERYPSCLAFVEALSGALPTAPRSGAVPVPPPLPRSSAKIPRPPTPEPEWRKQAGTARTVATSDIGTVADRPSRVRVRPLRPPPPPVWKLVLAGALTLLLVAAVAFGLWLVWHNSTMPSTEPADEEAAAGTTTTGKDDKKQDTTGGKTNDGKGGGNGDPKVTDQLVTPKGAVRDAAAKEVRLPDGRRAHDWVVVTLGEQDVRFRLITAGPAPFYVMESKVWNALYRAGGFTPTPGSVANGPNAPVTEVTADEARRFAAALGGRLPTPQEWDAAAGLGMVTGRDEVTRSGQPRVRLARPAPTHGPDAGTDSNEFGLRDMAGNGREWTSGKATDVNPQADPDLVILRGRNYTLSRGLTFEALRFEQATPQTQFATARSPYTGFRVVLELP
jgi:serine/threonine protein kinase